jgi:hypothetical protein
LGFQNKKQKNNNRSLNSQRMKKLFNSTAILFYVLMILISFFLGAYYAGVSGATEGQGLAGGAIVLGYGVFTSFIALLISLLLVGYLSREKVVLMNKGLGLILLLILAITSYRFLIKEQAETIPTSFSPTTVTTAASPVVENPEEFSPPQEDVELGPGFFTPDFFNESTLYFYGTPNFQKPVSDHTPFDSISFQLSDGNRYDISYAPPWLVPKHLKLDYEILHFTIQSVNRDFIEVVVNETNQRTAYVDRHAGKLTYWPDFLLQVHSVEFLHSNTQTVRVKPLHHAGTVPIDFQFMSPVRIQGDWMEVKLQDGGFQNVGEGWIEWRNESGLLISYSLLS